MPDSFSSSAGLEGGAVPAGAEVVFVFHSARDAVGGERSLLEGGLKVKVMALPSSLGSGCGLCLRVAAEDLESSRRALAASAISPRAAYVKTLENGKTAYVLLEEGRK